MMLCEMAFPFLKSVEERVQTFSLQQHHFHFCAPPRLTPRRPRSLVMFDRQFAP